MKTLYPALMSSFDEKYWNLSQAAAWVVYREIELVERTANPTPHSFGSIAMYPSSWPKNCIKHSTLGILLTALQKGSVVAMGYRCDGPKRLSKIPSAEWADFHLAPPYAYKADRLVEKFELWQDIRLESAAVKKKWRTFDEVSGRAKFDWETIKQIYENLRLKHTNISDNLLIVEIQLEYESRFNKAPPSRASIQPKLKLWSSG